MEKELRITGQADVKFSPDTTVIRLTLEGIEDTYEEANASLSYTISTLREKMDAIGLEKDAVKTHNLRVEPEHETVKDRKGNNVRKFIGFSYSENVMIKFANDNTKLSKVICAINDMDSRQHFTISFEISDLKKAHDLALEEATKDAVRKANIITSACGAKLAYVKAINYKSDFEEPRYRSYRNERILCNKAPMLDECDFDIDPDDVSLDEEVSIIWALE